MSIQIRVVNVNEVLRDMRIKMDDVKDDVRRAVAIAANDIRNEAIDRVPVNTGELRASIGIEYTNAGLGAVIGTNAPHSKWIEKGRGPGFPPLAPILYWVQRKLGIRDKTAKSVAFLIARKIGRVGFKAQPFLGPAYDRAIPRFLSRLRQLRNRR